MKEYVIKVLFEILVIVSVKVTKRVMLVNIQIMTIVSAKKKLVDKLVDECSETVEEVKLAKITFAKNENSSS